MAAKKLAIQLMEVLEALKTNPESKELITKRDDLVMRINKNAEVKDVSFIDLVNSQLQEEGLDTVEKFDFDTTLTVPQAKPKVKEVEKSKKEIITSSDFESHNVYLEITDSPNFDPYTGKPLKGKAVRKPFITSCHKMDYARCIRFHSKRKGNVICLYAPEDLGGKDAINELIKNKGKKPKKED